MMISRKLFLFLSTVLFSVFITPAFAGQLHTNKTIKAPDGRVRYFHYYVPNKVANPAPVVIVLHGGGQNYNKILRNNSAQREWLEIAEEEGMLVIIPNGINPKTGDADGTDQQWNDCRSDDGWIGTRADDVGFISTLVDWAAAKFSVEIKQVYAVGASNGGMMSYRLAFELSAKIAAIAAFVANLPEHSECSEPVHPTPVFICNGTKDRLMPWNGGEVGRGGTVISSTATKDFWIRFNGTGALPDQTKRYPDLDSGDASRVRSLLYSNGRQKSEVMFYTVEGGGHSMPSIDHQIGTPTEWLLGQQNHDVEIVRHAWRFLKRQRL